MADIYSQEKIPIAVLDFKGTNVPIAVSTAVTDLVKSDIVNTNLFRVLERQQIRTILEEQGFQQTGCTEESCAVEIGRLISAKKILIGEVTKVGITIIITARIVDVELGVVEYSAKEAAASEDNIVSTVSALSRNLLQIKGESIVKDTPKTAGSGWIIASYGTSTLNVSVEWDKVPGATIYHVYRSAYQDNGYLEIAQTNLTVYYDDTALPGKVYFYKILYEGPGGLRPLPAVDTGYIKLSPPQTVNASAGGRYDIGITWNSVRGSEKYYIFKALSQYSEYTEIDSTTDTYYYDLKASPGEKAWYKIKAWASTGFSDFSSPAQGYRLSGEELWKRGYYWRGLAPGWAQFYSGNKIRGTALGLAFWGGLAWTAFAVWNYNKSKDDYNELGPGLSQSTYDSAYNKYKRNGRIALYSIIGVVTVYAINVLDVYCFARPEPGKTAGILRYGNIYVNLNSGTDISCDQVQETRTDLSFAISF